MENFIGNAFAILTSPSLFVGIHCFIAMTLKAVAKYLPLFHALHLLSDNQISSLFKNTPEDVTKLFLEIAYNLTIRGSVALTAKEKTGLRVFSKELLRLGSRFTLKQKTSTLRRTPQLIRLLAAYMAKHLQ